MTCFLGDDLAVGRVHFRILLKLMILSIIFGWQVLFKINFSQKSGGKGVSLLVLQWWSSRSWKLISHIPAKELFCSSSKGTCCPNVLTRCAAHAGPSTIQAPWPTVNQQLNNMLSPWITTSTQGTPRFSNVVWSTTTRGFSWSCCTQLWKVLPSARGNGSFALAYCWFKKSIGLAAQAVTNL